MSAQGTEPASARQRLNAALADHLINDFTAHGAEVIANLRNEKPAEYMKMVTTAFQSEGAAPFAPAATSTNTAQRPAQPYTPVPPPEPKQWRMPPEIAEFLRLTGQ